jgi:hypothetical protein
MATTNFTFGRPSSGGSGFTKDEHLEHALVFVEPELTETTHPTYGDGQAARCSFVVCLTCDLVFADPLIYGAALVPALTDSGDELVVGRLGRGEAKPGRSPAWVLWNPSDDDLEAAREYFAKHATRYPSSGRISLEIRKAKRRDQELPAGANEPF